MNSSSVLDVFIENLKIELSRYLEYTDIYSNRYEKVIRVPSNVDLILKSIRKSINADNPNVKIYFDKKNTRDVDSLSYLKNLVSGDAKYTPSSSSPSSAISIGNVKQLIKDCIDSFNTTQGKQIRESIFRSNYTINSSYNDFNNQLLTVFCTCVLESTVGVILKTDPIFRDETLLSSSVELEKIERIKPIDGDSSSTNITINKTTVETSDGLSGLVIGGIIVAILIIGGLILFFMMGSSGSPDRRSYQPTQYIRSSPDAPGSPRSGPVKRGTTVLDTYKNIPGRDENIIESYNDKEKEYSDISKDIYEQETKEQSLSALIVRLQKERDSIENVITKSVRSDEIKNLEKEREKIEKKLKDAQTIEDDLRKSIKQNKGKWTDESLKKEQEKLKKSQENTKSIDADLNKIVLKILTEMRAEQGLEEEKKKFEELTEEIKKTQEKQEQNKQAVQEKYSKLTEVKTEMDKYNDEMMKKISLEESKQKEADNEIKNLLDSLDQKTKSLINYLRNVVLKEPPINIYTLLAEVKKDPSFSKTKQKDMIKDLALDKLIEHDKEILYPLSEKQDKKEIKNIISTDNFLTTFLHYDFKDSNGRKKYVESVVKNTKETSQLCVTLDIENSTSLKQLNEALNKYKETKICNVDIGANKACDQLANIFEKTEKQEELDGIINYKKESKICKGEAEKRFEKIVSNKLENSVLNSTSLKQLKEAFEKYKNAKICNYDICTKKACDKLTSFVKNAEKQEELDGIINYEKERKLCKGEAEKIFENIGSNVKGRLTTTGQKQSREEDKKISEAKTVSELANILKETDIPKEKYGLINSSLSKILGGQDLKLSDILFLRDVMKRKGITVQQSTIDSKLKNAYKKEFEDIKHIEDVYENFISKNEFKDGDKDKQKGISRGAILRYIKNLKPGIQIDEKDIPDEIVDKIVININKNIIKDTEQCLYDDSNNKWKCKNGKEYTVLTECKKNCTTDIITKENKENNLREQLRASKEKKQVEKAEKPKEAEEKAKKDKQEAEEKAKKDKQEAESRRLAEEKRQKEEAERLADEKKKADQLRRVEEAKELERERERMAEAQIAQQKAREAQIAQQKAREAQKIINQQKKLPSLNDQSKP